MKSGARLLFSLLILGALVFFGGKYWLSRAMQRSASAADTTQQAFTVEKSETAASIAGRLEAKNLIVSGFAFTWAASARNLDGGFHPGTFRLAPSMTGNAILQTLTSAAADIRITLPEGLTVADMAQKLSDAGIADPASIRACAQTCTYTLSVLAGRPAGASLEGYLFPDTYDFHTGSAARDVIDKLVRNFNVQLGEDLRAKITASGHSTNEIVTMASIIEKEVANPHDRRIVSGILWARLEKKIPLGVDAALIYALAGKHETLTADELRSNSPYNTRLHTGLPPGPICNPGLDALKAALSPEKTEYLFYLTDPQGAAHYARTNAEHEQNKRDFLGG